MSDDRAGLPAYAQTDIKKRLLASGASGTIYALVMLESEAAIQAVVDGIDLADIPEIPGHEPVDLLRDRRDERWLCMFREPWMQRQDDFDVAYFDKWIEWASPIVRFDASQFKHRYPTAGASEGIFKLMADYQGWMRRAGTRPSIAVFRGEYEGFTKFAEALGLQVTVHDRDDLEATVRDMIPGAQFWISQPSAIDGRVWDRFDEFLSMVDERHGIEVVPDLTYVGAVARDFHIDLDHDCVSSFVFSHSKPFGGYYHRCGGVFSTEDQLSLVGNRWFKNLTSIAWGTEMMTRHAVHQLPSRYRSHQIAAVARIARLLDIQGMRPADVSVIATAPAPAPEDRDEVIDSLVRKIDGKEILRICLTASMSVAIDPGRLAPTTADLVHKGTQRYLDARYITSPGLHWWHIPQDDSLSDIVGLRDRKNAEGRILSLSLRTEDFAKPDGMDWHDVTVDHIDPKRVLPENLDVADEIVLFDEEHGLYKLLHRKAEEKGQPSDHEESQEELVGEDVEAEADDEPAAGPQSVFYEPFAHQPMKPDTVYPSPEEMTKVWLTKHFGKERSPGYSRVFQCEEEEMYMFRRTRGPYYIATGWAHEVQAEMPDGRAVQTGYPEQPLGFDAPISAHFSAHDAALVDGRFIVDGWVVDAKLSKQAVFDLQDPGDVAALVAIHGSMDKWEVIPDGRPLPPHATHTMENAA